MHYLCLLSYLELSWRNFAAKIAIESTRKSTSNHMAEMNDLEALTEGYRSLFLDGTLHAGSSPLLAQAP